MHSLLAKRVTGIHPLFKAFLSVGVAVCYSGSRGAAFRCFVESMAFVLSSLRSGVERFSWAKFAPNRRMRTRMSGGVAGEAGRPVPLCRSVEAHPYFHGYELGPLSFVATYRSPLTPRLHTCD